ncbi:MAG TPA: 4-hydroxythreonine-4-phosphate dehydrogenase PdxA [Arenibaculum sp.]|nr:4-hydroxythreonine-4-phosphate dehydrogenase PdxA [Arenibaculum sp.]
MGEPAGIGGEIALMAWAARRERPVPPFVVIDDPGRLEALAGRIGLRVPVRSVGDAREAPDMFAEAMPVLPLKLAAAVEPGRPDPANGPAVVAAIDRAVGLVRAGAAAAVVTNPIQKSALYRAGFEHPGHTEYLAHLAGMTDEPVMMLEGGGLRVVLATIHLPLREVPDALTRDGIVHCAEVTLKALANDFAIERPRLAVAALNPHAGEQGALGREEMDVISPAVDRLRASGHAVEGPLPADTLFHEAARRRFDAVVCMYHDQGLIPLKTLDFDGGVNITLGLPFVRTSPDHGTALDIAGQGRASPRSLIAALETAARLAHGRRTAPVPVPVPVPGGA